MAAINWDAFGDKLEKVANSLIYLRRELTLPGETLGDFGKVWRSLSTEDRAELTDSARKEMAARMTLAWDAKA